MMCIFQSTHPCWVRPQKKQYGLHKIIISIHAPVLGATVQFPPLKILDNVISIHAPVLGATNNIIEWMKPSLVISIHAPVLGATRPPPASDQCASHFNPRTRAGCDIVSVADGNCTLTISFQSTHPCWVRRRTSQICQSAQYRFQSTHPCWVRPVSICSSLSIRTFQSTHPCWVRQEPGHQ